MSTPSAARTLAGILHATHTADQTRELLAAHAAEVLAEDADRRAQPARPAPRTPSPLLVRELIEVARAQTPAPTSPLCGEPVNLPGGRTVTCSKLANHQNGWHRRGTDSWKTIFGNPKGRHIQRGATADELGKLRILARDWRTALQKLSQCSTCRDCCGIAQAALAQHPDTPINMETTK